jgi:hypothetical protein
MSLTVALVENRADSFEHVGQISDAVFELKHYGKSFQGSTVVKERRGQPAPEEAQSEPDVEHLSPGQV